MLVGRSARTILLGHLDRGAARSNSIEQLKEGQAQRSSVVPGKGGELPNIVAPRTPQWLEYGSHQKTPLTRLSELGRQAANIGIAEPMAHAELVSDFQSNVI